jgi:signal transduction histidine kinase
LDLPENDIVIDRECATALFRILQETLTNVSRHSNATRVTIRLAEEQHILVLEVHDNGKGISKEELSAGRSLGILGMRERAWVLGGGIAIRGAPDEGTTIEVRIPET